MGRRRTCDPSGTTSRPRRAQVDHLPDVVGSLERGHPGERPAHTPAEQADLVVVPGVQLVDLLDEDLDDLRRRALHGEGRRRVDLVADEPERAAHGGVATSLPHKPVTTSTGCPSPVCHGTMSGVDANRPDISNTMRWGSIQV